MLKFESLAQIGDVIKAYDFKPMKTPDPEYPDAYVVGTVIAKGMVNGVACYEIRCEEDTFRGSRVGKSVFVPFEVSFMEYDERVSVVEYVA